MHCMEPHPKVTVIIRLRLLEIRRHSGAVYAEKRIEHMQNQLDMRMQIVQHGSFFKC